jgi:hypothetical protein
MASFLGLYRGPRGLVLVAILTTSALIGCGDDDGGSDAGPADGGTDAGPPPPPEMCATGGTPALQFRDATEDYDVHAGGLDVLANRVSVGDLDGDGYPDVIVHRVGSANPADFTAARRDWPYRVLMNRERGLLRSFEDATRESNYGALREPTADAGRAAHFAVYADFDDDGDLDVLSGTYSDPTRRDLDPGHRTELLLNDGNGVLALAPFSPALAGSESGARLVPTTSAALLDHDRDGLVDVFFGNWYANYGGSLAGVQDTLARNLGAGAFEDITDLVGLTATGDIDTHSAAAPTYGVTACDVDADGDEDLLVSAYGRRFNQLYLRTADGYVEAGEASGFDGDDNEDYTDSEFYKCYCQTTGMCTAGAPRIACDGLYWNAGVDDQPFRLNGNTFTTACGDVDADGDMDLYSAEIHHWHIGESSDSPELLVNSGPNADGVPVFTRPGNAATGLTVPRVGTSWNEGGISSGMGDLDNDGRMDILLGTSDYPDQALWIYRQLPDGTFQQVAADVGVDHACAPGFSLADLDRDGDLDLLVASGTARDCATAWPDGPPLRIYENVNAQSANHTQIHLEGAGAVGGGANRSAIGALVRVTAGGRTQTQEVQGGFGHFGLQFDADLTFGLGDTCQIESIEVRWPDAAGTTERFENVRANYRIVLRQGEGLTYLTE